VKFAPNRMYIESYNKCPNCGVLLYEKPQSATSAPVVSGGKTYCSTWCVEWEADRAKRRAAAMTA
jgi:hypothetical protein